MNFIRLINLLHNLYNEALIHFLGGTDKIVVPIEINYQNKMILSLRILSKKSNHHFLLIEN